MFCPECGKSDQTADSYCRECGEFLIDPKKQSSFFEGKTRNDKIFTSFFLNILSLVFILMIAGASLMVLLKEESRFPFVHIFVFSMVAVFWQIFSVYNLYKVVNPAIKELKDKTSSEQSEQNEIGNSEKIETLPAADFEAVVPMSVTEKTTKELKVKPKRSS